MTHSMPLNNRVEAGGVWGVQQLEGVLHKLAVLVACFLTARWRSCSRHSSLTASRQAGRRPTEGPSLSLPVSPLKQEETSRLSAVFLGQNLTA